MTVHIFIPHSRNEVSIVLGWQIKIVLAYEDNCIFLGLIEGIVFLDDVAHGQYSTEPSSVDKQIYFYFLLWFIFCYYGARWLRGSVADRGSIGPEYEPGPPRAIA